MQKELELLQPQLLQSAEAAVAMMKVIDVESREAEVIQDKVRGEETLANEQAAESQALKETCEADLAEALPALQSAISALDTIKVSDYTNTL